MAEAKDPTSVPLSQAGGATIGGGEDPEDPAKSPPKIPNSSTREVHMQSFVSIWAGLNVRGVLDLGWPESKWEANPFECIQTEKPNIDVMGRISSLDILLRAAVCALGLVQALTKFNFKFSSLACCLVLRSWVSKKFMTGCVVLFPVAVTFFITWWFIQFVDGFFSPLYDHLGIDIFGLGFITSLLFVFFVGIFVSSWTGATVIWIGEWIIKRMPLVSYIYSASKQISAAVSPDQNTTAFKEVAIIRHPREGEYAFGFITSTVILQRDNGDEELCTVYVPTNNLYIGDILLVNSKEIIRPNLSIREGIEIIVSGGMTMPQVLSPAQGEAIPVNRM